MSYSSSRADVDQAGQPISGGGASGTVTVSNFPATQAVSGTVTANAGTGTMAVSAASLPLPAGAATAAKQPALGVAGTPSTDVITVQGVASMTALKVDGSGVTQPVSGTVTANAGTGTMAVSAASLPLPAGAATSAKQPALGTAGSASADVLSVQGIASMTALKVDGSGVTQPVSGTFFQATQPVSGTVTANQGTANTAANAWTAKVTDGTNTAAVKAASTAAAATDPALVVAVSPNNTITAAGNKTNNNATPGATNYGTIPVLANAAPPAWTEGNLVTHSADLKGNLRVLEHPMDALGYYRIGIATSAYTGLAAGSAIIALRWGDSTRLMVITRLSIWVLTTTAATVAGTVDRKLVIARSFTVADTGGTAVVLTTNNNKARTSQGTSLVSDFRVTSGSALTAGTRTLDVNGYGIASAFLPVSTTGITIPQTDFVNTAGGRDHPLVLATSEGFEIQIATAMPTTAVNQTYIAMEWAEVNAF